MPPQYSRDREISGSFQQVDFPLPALVGNANAKLALMLLAVDPQLKGVLLTSSASSARSVIARAARSLFPSFIQLPTQLSEEQLLGGIDLEPTLLTGRRHLQRGLLARADGGAIFVDDVDRFDAGILKHLIVASDSGIVRLEREGLSQVMPADFVLIATSNSSESAGHSPLRDRVGLIVQTDEVKSIDERTEIVNRVLEYEIDQREFVRQFTGDLSHMIDRIGEARKKVADIEMTERDVRRLAEAGLLFGVAGNRADIFALRAARAHAAHCQRQSVVEEDLIAAIQLVLLPRATRLPQDQETSAFQNPEAIEERAEDSSSRDAEADNLRNSKNENQNLKTEAVDNRPQPEKLEMTAEDLILKAIDSQVTLSSLHSQINRQAVSRRLPTGKRSERVSRDRGRQLSSSARKSSSKKIAIAPTLRAASPFQRHRILSGHQKDASDRRILVTPQDLRYKRFKRQSGILFIFAVDASGSMALNRFAMVKGAMIRLLRQAYLHRDQVALISFRRQSADVLLEPTRSVDLAKRVVEAIPAGGATPIAIGLLKSLAVADQAMSRGAAEVILVLFTDGGANIDASGKPFSQLKECGSSISDELKEIGALMRTRGIRVVVMDTKTKYIAGNEARTLAANLGAQYSYLPRANEQAIYEKVRDFAALSQMT